VTGLKYRFCLAVSSFLTAAVLAGCGGSSSKSTPKPAGSSTVTLLTSSDANSRFVSFGMSIDSLSLTNKAGITTTVYSTPSRVDFLPWNGQQEPLASFTVPQDEYTTATVTVSNPWFTHIYMGDNGYVMVSWDGFLHGLQGSAPPVVDLPAPLTIDKSETALVLSLQSAKSGSVTTSAGKDSYSITPAFTLGPFAIPGGLLEGIPGQVAAIDPTAHTVTLNVPAGDARYPRTLTVHLVGTIAWQGISSTADLALGQLLDVDATLQADGTYAAKRIEVRDKTATDEVIGQLLQWVPSWNWIAASTRFQAGEHLFPSPLGQGASFVYDGSTVFQTSATFPDLASLPFTPRFDATTMAAGQMVSIGSSFISYTGAAYSTANSVTLLPQYLNGTVQSIGSSGKYDLVTVHLADYDLIPQMNSGTTTFNRAVLSNGGTVYVYVDSTVAAKAQIATGRVLRFRGLLFNDAGVLRFACDKVVPGVDF
jgi:hypothetical protein